MEQHIIELPEGASAADLAAAVAQCKARNSQAIIEQIVALLVAEGLSTDRIIELATPCASKAITLSDRMVDADAAEIERRLTGARQH